MLSEILSPAAQSLLSTIQKCNQIRPADPTKSERSKKHIERTGKLRGRPLIYPMLPSGRGSGPFIELMDGSVKMDLITGIGVHIFGHGHPELLLEGLKAATKATSMQGTLMPGIEYANLSELLLELANRPSAEGNAAQMEAAWLTSCGTMANELALKILRQKKSPSYKIIAFKNCFTGRSTTMQEITDEPKYREGQPLFDQVSYLDFYNEKISLDENIKKSIADVDALLKKSPHCGVSFELVQGEGGGFRSAPEAWWKALLGHCKEKDLGIWIDEVQTFARTGEPFAYQRFHLGSYADVVSVAKPLHCGAVMWTKDYAPKPGLIAGTFAGSTVALALGFKVMEMLKKGHYFGLNGKIRKFEDFVLKDWEERSSRLKSQGVQVGSARVTGGMIAFEVLDGKAGTIKNYLNKLFDKGIIGFSAGRTPVMLRFLPPVGVITTDQWKDAMDIVEESLKEFSRETLSS